MTKKSRKRVRIDIMKRKQLGIADGKDTKWRMKKNDKKKIEENHLLVMMANEIDDIIYLSNPQTYELIYLNRSALKLLGLSKNIDYRGYKCYKILQGLDKPCDFCTNQMLTTKQYYIWEHYNQILNRHFIVRDKLVDYHGQLIRMEIATDITEKEEQTRELASRLSVEKALVLCIDTLKNGQDIDTAINSLLKHIGNFYKAERAYTFEVSFETQIVNNTYEWCQDGVQPQIEYLQNVPLSSISRWMEAFDESGCIVISSVGKTVNHDSLEYQLLTLQGIERLIAAPLSDHTGKMIGFIGVDNPVDNLESPQLISATANFVADDIEKRQMFKQLEQMSYKDALTSVKNKAAYQEAECQMEEKMRLDSPEFGVVVLDINNLKRVNDTFGHDFGDMFIVEACRLICKAFKCSPVYRVGGDEFVVILENSDLEHYTQLLTELQRQVEEHNRSSNIGYPLSIACGVAIYDNKIDQVFANVFKRADEAMYQNKAIMKAQPE